MSASHGERSVLAFDQLTKRGRTARLRQLTEAALLDEFGIDASRISLLSAHSFNTFFRADTANGPLAVRVGEVRIHADGIEEVEARWLAAIRADTELQMARLLPARCGNHVAIGTHPSVPGGRHCSVMTWLPGRPAHDRFDHTVPRRLGVVLAMLHEHAVSYRPAMVPDEIVANRVVYFADTSLLAAYPSTHGSLFHEASDRVQRHLDELWSSPPHEPNLLHGDLGPHNLMRWRNRLTPIDFQDLQFGFDLQDLGITVCDLRRGYDESMIDELKIGYGSVRPWPLHDPALGHVFAAQRSLNMVNLGLNLRRPGWAEHIDRHAALIARWMTGLSPRAPLI